MEDMKVSDRGSKHFCAECEIKFYDLGREVVACPRCGAKPAPPKALKKAPAARKAGRMTYG